MHIHRRVRKAPSPFELDHSSELSLDNYRGKKLPFLVDHVNWKKAIATNSKSERARIGAAFEFKREGARRWMSILASSRSSNNPRYTGSHLFSKSSANTEK